MRDGIKEDNRVLIGSSGRNFPLAALLFICTIQFGNDCWNTVLKYCFSQYSCWKQLVGKPDWPLGARILFHYKPSDLCKHRRGKKSFVSLSWEVSNYLQKHFLKNVRISVKFMAKKKMHKIFV